MKSNIRAIVITENVQECILLHNHVGDLKFEQSFSIPYPYQETKDRYNATWFWWFYEKGHLGHILLRHRLAGNSGTLALETAVRINPGAPIYNLEDFIRMNPNKNKTKK